MRPLRGLWRWLTLPRGRRAHPFHGVARRRGTRRGVALLMVITCIAFMTVLVTEINYAARVRLSMSAHARDESMAYWLARSGVGLYQLILIADKQLTGDGGVLSGLASAGFGSLWEMLPAINTGLMRMFFVSGGSVNDQELEEFQAQGLSEEQREESRADSRFADKGFLDFEGDFAAEITAEDTRINVNRLGSSCPSGVCSAGELRLDDTALALFALMSGQEHDQWFYDRDLERWDLIANLADWIDQDTMRCTAQGGYEDSVYQRGDSPYRAKNGKFETYQEIRLVEGWQDEVFQRFGGELTIHGDGKININTATPEMMAALLKAHLTPTPSDFEVERIQQQLADYTMILSWTKPKEFGDWLQSNGYEVRDPKALTSSVKVRSTVFTVTSVGSVGDTAVTITAVLDFSSSGQGRVRYWRVD